MPKDQFEDLNKRLEYCHDLEGEERKVLESMLRTPQLIDDQLEILNSGIFYEGQFEPVAKYSVKCT